MIITYEQAQRAVHVAIETELRSHPNPLITPALLDRVRVRAMDIVMRLPLHGEHFYDPTISNRDRLLLHAVVDGIIGLQAYAGPMAPWRNALPSDEENT